MRESKGVNVLIPCALFGAEVRVLPDKGGKMFGLYVNDDRVAEAFAPGGSKALSKYAFENGASKVHHPFDLRIDEEYR